MKTNYIFSGYRIYKYDTPVVDDLGYGKYNPKYLYYTKLENKATGETTEIKFTSLQDAKEWCRKHYLEGVIHGWVEEIE